ncbi:MAG: hypothetical protein WDN29_12895 [Methylovirgula sp.]
MIFSQQIGKRLVGELLKAAAPFLTQQINGRPGLVVELDTLADHRG